MKRKSKKPQDQQDDRNSPEHRLDFTIRTCVVQAISSDVTVGQAYVGRRGLTEETEEI